LKTEGRLEEQDLPDLVQELSRERWSGTLRLLKGDHRIGIVAENGQLVFATSSNPDYRLGPRLLLAFQWGSGSYKLEVGGPASEAIKLNISTPQLILDGIGQVEAWSRVERGCGGLQARYAVVSGVEALFNQLTLDVDQAALARAAGKGREVEALCSESVLNDFEACRTLWAFRVIGLVKRLEEARPLDEDGLEYVLPADGHS
jgi:hypothetical protein